MQEENEGYQRRGTIKHQMKGGIAVATTENTVPNTSDNSVEMESTVRTEDNNRTDAKSHQVYTERVMYSEKKKPTRYQDLENNYGTSSGMEGQQFPRKTSADKSAHKKDDIIKYCAFVMFCIIFVIFLVQTFLSQVQNSRQQYIVPSHQYIQPETTPGQNEEKQDDFVFEGDLGVFVQSMQTFPQEIFTKFQMGYNSDKFKQEWDHDVYGGSVLDPIVEVTISNDGHKKAEEVPNYLRAHLQNLRSGWHYFHLKNIFIKRKRDHSFFADVEMIVTDPLRKEDYDMLREIEARFKGTYSQERSSFLKEDYTKLEEFATMEEIEPFLSGYGRVINYDVSGYAVSNSDGTKVYDPFVNPELNKITQIKEGQFFEGKAEGYCRIMDPSRRVQVGFFKEDWPYGKLKEFVDGELSEQGIVDELFNDDDESSFLKALDIKSFEENVDPMDFEDVSEN